MSDLLASLVDRALDRAPVLQRRQPSLFEPVAEASLPGGLRLEAVSPLHEEDTVAELDFAPAGRKTISNTHATQSTHQPSSFKEPQPLRPESRLAPRPARDLNRLEDNQENPRQMSPLDASVTDSPENPMARQERGHNLMPQAKQTGQTGETMSAMAKPIEITVAPSRLVETIVEKRVEREVVSEALKGSPSIKESDDVTRPLTDRARARDGDDQQVIQPLRPESKRASPETQESNIRPLKQKAPPPRYQGNPVVRAVSRIESTRVRSEPPAPTINVTIGRVEVRATSQANARPPAARPAAPRMSLEDYLRSRREGKQG